MAGHTSEKRWEVVSQRASAEMGGLLGTLFGLEEAYQQMQEIYIYAGGTAPLLAELLFREEIAARSSPENVASQEEIDKCADLVSAMTSAHQIYQAATNVTVTQSDRLTEMRRMI